MMSRLTAAMAIAALAACGGSPEPPPAEPATADPPPAPEPAPTPETLPELITAERGGFIPEGVEYDANAGRLLTGSLSEGSVFEIHPDGRVTPLVSDPDLVSSVGIEVDEERNRLIVANSDRAVFQGETSGQAMLGVYDLTTGERLAMVDLTTAISDPPADASYFANDATVDADGAIFVTDTRMGVVYRVGSEYDVTVAHRFTDYSPNGIVAHPDGYLLVVGGSAVWKVVPAEPDASAQVSLPEEIGGQDGAIWTSDGRLAIVSNSSSRVVALTSDDDWATAALAGVASFEGQATTAAAVGDDVYVVQPHFADDDPPTFERVVFE